MSPLRATAAFLLGCILLLAARPLHAAPEAEDSSAEELLKQLEALALPSWQNTAKLGLGAGYESNPLLSSFSAQGAALARLELEDFVLNTDWHGLELLGMLNGSVTRYLSPPPGLAGKQSWFLHGESRLSPRKGTRLALTATGYLTDDIIDLSLNDSYHFVAPLRVWGGKTSLQVRQSLPARFWLEARAELHRSSYLHYPAAFTEPGASLRLGWDSKAGLSLSLAGRSQRRSYAERNESTAGGRPLPGTRLKLLQHEGETSLSWKKAWHGQWAFAAKGRLGETRDEASGFFDYRQEHLETSLSWEQDDWRLSLELSQDHYRYLLQTVGMGLQPPHRTRRDREALLELEYALSEKLRLQLNLHHENSTTNEEFSNYQNRGVVLCLYREF